MEIQPNYKISLDELNNQSKNETWAEERELGKKALENALKTMKNLPESEQINFYLAVVTRIESCNQELNAHYMSTNGHEIYTETLLSPSDLKFIEEYAK